jgi:hypothetical protein
LVREEGKSRVFELNGRKYFICVCYDSFGIKHSEMPNFGVDAILDLVHGFYPTGEGYSGVGNFARHGLAGASNRWKCPIFCSTIFFRRKMPKNFPSAVNWNKGDTYSSKCTYERIAFKPAKERNIKIKEGTAAIKIYDLN